MGKFNTAKQFIGQIFGGKQKTTGQTINPFKGNPQTGASKQKIKLAKIPGQVQKKFMPIQRDMQKTSVAFKQINQKLKGEPVTKSGVSKGKDLREKKMGGGMMGRRMGYSEGSSKGKIPTTPKEKSLAKLAPPKDKITFGDVVAGRTKGKRMQAKDGTSPKQFMRKEDPMRDRKKQPLKSIRGIIDKQGKIVGTGTMDASPKVKTTKRKSDRSRKIGSNTYRRKP
jgi:hypothetical protein